MREWLALLAVLTVLWTVHLGATRATGLRLEEETRTIVGASAETVWSRFHAHFTAPFFHDGLPHLAYNTALLAIGLPLAVRAWGMKAILVGYLASPVAGILVDLLLILPLAKLGFPAAVTMAQARLVGASVVAFALLGIALASYPTSASWITPALFLGIATYELALGRLGLTRPFVWAHHLAGLTLGALAPWAWSILGARPRF